MTRMEDGFQQCAEAYAARVEKTVEQLQKEGIFPRRCRCRPENSSPHCGGFYMIKTEPGKIHHGEKRLTALHGEEITA